MTRVKAFLYHQSGGVAIEYLLAASFIAIGVLVAFNGIGGLAEKPTSSAFNAATSIFGKATGEKPAQPDRGRTYSH